ncbi:hypothetical protein AX16_003022 [Volvariella volvacea WC 439]|nr:hypothetical protein AX16_003022 [Volvariella volvacea WC 439]
MSSNPPPIPIIHADDDGYNADVDQNHGGDDGDAPVISQNTPERRRTRSHTRKNTTTPASSFTSTSTPVLTLNSNTNTTSHPTPATSSTPTPTNPTAPATTTPSPTATPTPTTLPPRSSTPPHVCTECDKSFTRSDALAKHMRLQHNISPPAPGRGGSRKRKRAAADDGPSVGLSAPLLTTGGAGAVHGSLSAMAAGSGSGAAGASSSSLMTRDRGDKMAIDDPGLDDLGAGGASGFVAFKVDAPDMDMSMSLGMGAGMGRRRANGRYRSPSPHFPPGGFSRGRGESPGHLANGASGLGGAGGGEGGPGQGGAAGAAGENDEGYNSSSSSDSLPAHLQQHYDPETNTVLGRSKAMVKYILMKAKERYALEQHVELLEQLRVVRNEYKREKEEKERLLDELLRRQFGSQAEFLIDPADHPANPESRPPGAPDAGHANAQLQQPGQPSVYAPLPQHRDHPNYQHHQAGPSSHPQHPRDSHGHTHVHGQGHHHHHHHRHPNSNSSHSHSHPHSHSHSHSHSHTHHHHHHAPSSSHGAALQAYPHTHNHSHSHAHAHAHAHAHPQFHPPNHHHHQQQQYRSRSPYSRGYSPPPPPGGLPSASTSHVRGTSVDRHQAAHYSPHEQQVAGQELGPGPGQSGRNGE